METQRAFALPLPLIVALLALLSLLVSVPAFPATFVVDPTGNDANPGSDSAPWATVRHAAAQAAAGDTVVIHAGTYAEAVNLSRSGTDGNPIVFAADPGAVLVSPNATASLSAFNVASGVGYVTLNGIEATGGFDETIFLRSGTHDIQIQGCNLHNNHAGIIMGGASHITITGCALHNNTDLGLRLTAGTHDVLISDSDSYANGVPTTCSSKVDGFTASADAFNVTFARARAYNNGGDGFDVKGDHVVFDEVSSFGNACTGLKMWQTAAATQCLVAHNGLTGLAVMSSKGGTTVDITNCTVAYNGGVQANLHNPPPVGAPYTVNLLNNIFAGSNKTIQYGSRVILSEAYDIFYLPKLYGNVLAPTIGRRFSGHDINTGVWTLLSHQGQATLAVDPQFVDAANGDFHVGPNSAAVGRGLSLAPDAGASNIGAYAQPTGPTNHTPWADAGRDTQGHVGRAVSFSAVGSLDPDGDPLSYSWDFGDGSPAVSGYQVTHVFSAAGKYFATLTVSDGSLSNAKTIQVLSF